jgi:hypothetical protein
MVPLLLMVLSEDSNHEDAIAGVRIGTGAGKPRISSGSRISFANH